MTLPRFSTLNHWTHLKRDQGWSRITLLGRFAPAWDLLLCAKRLFVAAMVVAIAPAGGSKDEQYELFSPEF
jgi:hypothetical protein